MKTSKYQELKASLYREFGYVESDGDSTEFRIYKYYRQNHYEQIEVRITLYPPNKPEDIYDYEEPFIVVKLTPELGIFNGNYLHKMGFTLDRVLHNFKDKEVEEIISDVYFSLDSLYEGYKAVSKFIRKNTNEKDNN